MQSADPGASRRHSWRIRNGGQQAIGQGGPACYWHATDRNHPNVQVQLELLPKNFYDLGKLVDPTTAVPGVGDEVYLDKDSALYVHTGSTYLYIQVVTPKGTNNTVAERRAATQITARL